ncbi:hypothetical protein Dimus_039095 [Dionaea muscipula]
MLLAYHFSFTFPCTLHRLHFFSLPLFIPFIISTPSPVPFSFLLHHFPCSSSFYPTKPSTERERERDAGDRGLRERRRRREAEGSEIDRGGRGVDKATVAVADSVNKG